MSAFTSELKVRYIDGKYWVLLSPFEYYVGDKDDNEHIFVPAGFKTDFASIPRLAWPVMGHPAGRHGKAAVIHDFLYRYPDGGSVPDDIVPPIRSRRRCDQIFLEGMVVLGVAWWKRTVMYSAVRVGGRGVWKKWRKADREREGER